MLRSTLVISLILAGLIIEAQCCAAMSSDAENQRLSQDVIPWWKIPQLKTRALHDYGKQLTLEELCRRREKLIDLSEEKNINDQARQNLLPDSTTPNGNSALFEDSSVFGVVPRYLVAGLCEKSTAELLLTLNRFEEAFLTNTRRDLFAQKSTMYSQGLQEALAITWDNRDLQTCWEVVQIALRSPITQERNHGAEMLYRLLRDAKALSKEVVDERRIRSALAKLKTKENEALAESDASRYASTGTSKVNLKITQEILDYLESGDWPKRKTGWVTEIVP